VSVGAVSDVVAGALSFRGCEGWSCSDEWLPRRCSEEIFAWVGASRVIIDSLDQCCCFELAAGASEPAIPADGCAGLVNGADVRTVGFAGAEVESHGRVVDS
jgi:hypothetical protein